MRFIYRSLAALFAILIPAGASAQVYQTYGNWSVACDNTRTCSAFGYSAQSDSNAFVRVTRRGEPGALPVVLVAVTSAGPARARKMELEIQGTGAHRTAVGPLDAVSDGDYAQATIGGSIAKIFAGALSLSRTLTIRLEGRTTPDERGTVLLDGAAAAFRAMDARQGRAGTMTALVAHGDAPASAVPPVPAAPVVLARRMREVPPPKPPGPNPVHGADPICASAPEIWIALGGGKTVRGVCSEGGAYNTGYRFFFAGAGRPVPVEFRNPWRRPADQVTLVNPELSSDGLRLTAFSKGIGLGTCGEASEWVWTGSEFRLARLSEMRECRGIESTDWPVLYRATVQAR